MSADSADSPRQPSEQTPDFDPGAKTRLTPHDLGRFTGETLFDRLARAVCHAGCLPRKELYEAWEVARRTRRLFRGGRVVDLAGGHGLLAHVLLLLDDRSPTALVVERTIPASAGALQASLLQTWPRLAGRVEYVQVDLGAVVLTGEDLVVASHACGALTDVVLNRAAEVRARVAVLPCCHDLDACDPGPLSGWMPAPLAVDALRALALEQRGYHVRTQLIPERITPMNRLLLGVPLAAGATR